MKSILKLIIPLFALAIIFTSCSNTNDELKMIPSNALVVVHFNMKSLSAKLSRDEIKQSNWYKELYKDTTVKAWAKKLMDDPASAGIDPDAALFLFVQKKFGESSRLVVEGNIKSATAFEAFNKSINESSATAKDGDISTLILRDETVVGWNDKKFAYVANMPDLPGNMSPAQAGLKPNLSLLCKNLFALKTDSSMAKIDKFGSLLKEEGDVHVWQNTEEMVSSSNQMGALGMLKLDALLKGNLSTTTASFDNGKITAKQKFYVSPELADILKKYGGGKVNTDMIKNIPSQNINGFLAVHFNPEGLKEIIKLTGMDGLVNSSLSSQGITINDFVKANKGDVLFTVTDLITKKDSFSFGNQALKDTSYSYTKPSATFLFSLNIGDKPSFDKLMAAVNKFGDVKAELGVYTAENNTVFAVANSQDYLSKYMAGSNNKFDFIDKIADHPVAFFVDIQKILSAVSTLPSKDTSGNVILNESIKTWQNIYSLGGEFKDGAFIMNTEVNLSDKNINSLKQLSGYFDRISGAVMEKKKGFEGKLSKADSTVIYPPLSGLDTVPAGH